MNRLLEEAKKAVKIHSFGLKGNEELANYFMNLMKDRGLKVELQRVTHSRDDISKRQFNVIGILGDPLVDRKIKKGLLLLSHLDTAAKGSPVGWTKGSGNPLHLVSEEDTIYGLGVAEAKLDFLCKLHAIQQFREKKLKEPIYLVGTCGSDFGMIGTKYLLESFRLNPNAVLVGGATDLKIGQASRQMALYKVMVGYHLVEKDARGFNRMIRLKCRGKSSHASCLNNGVDALEHLIQFTTAAIDNGYELQLVEFCGGEAWEQVADESQARFYLTSHQFEDFKRFFRETKGRNKSELPLFEMELGGLGDTGIGFLPEVLFPVILDLRHAIKSLVSMKGALSQDAQGAVSNMNVIKQGRAKTEILFDLRVSEKDPLVSYEEKLQEEISKIGRKYPAVTITLKKEYVNPGVCLKDEDPLILNCKRSLAEIGIKSKPEILPQTTEAGHFAKAGYSAAVFGPGEFGGNCYGPDEKLNLNQIEMAVSFYSKMIEASCAG